MNTKKFTKIEIYSRGKNRDIYGNPYHAFVIRFYSGYVSHYRTISLEMPMTYRSSSKDDCFGWADQATKEAFGFSLYDYKSIILHHHKTVRTDAELEEPQNWKLPEINN